MAVTNDGTGEWRCPECGDTIRFVGPTTEKRFIDDHIYWRHRRPDRERYLEQQRVEWLRSRVVADPLDEAFYDGARLTHPDMVFLSSIGIRWSRLRLTAGK
jgi:hypothetical protein